MVEAFGLSDRGCVRKNNEDCFLLAREIGLYLVADGMGGAQAGELASKMAVEVAAEAVHAAPARTPEVLVQAFEEAHRRVLEAANNDVKLEGMGTTLVGVLECNDVLAVANVGDSRAYLCEQETVYVVTEDHTWVREVGRNLGLEEEQLKTHPMRHVLTMAIGVFSPLRIHTYSLQPAPGSQLLLCSDGLHGVVDAKTLGDVLRSRQSLESKGHYLIEAARKAGGPDNITVVLLDVV